MSKISNIIFNGKEHYITSPYGRREVINTSAGSTSSFHYGTDYGTNGLKIAQYAIENGTILDCGRASDGANYIWVKYPRINKKFLHYHLDSIKVSDGQSVSKGTLLGYTGMTGKATGIHLHLGVVDLTTGDYEDPEVYAKNYSESYQTGLYRVTADLLRVRRGPSTAYEYLRFNQLSANAQSQVRSLNGGYGADGIVEGVECTVYQIENNWGRIPSGWVCLDYCRRI